ncbi:DNA recombination protein RmuC [Rhodopseudomonas parapalustris]
MDQILFRFGDLPISVGMAGAAFAAVALALLAIIAVLVARGSAVRRGAEIDQRLALLMRAQHEANGRVDAMGRALAGRQAEMARAMSERLDSVTHRFGQSLTQSTRYTMQSLQALHERLGIIDRAHDNLTELTDQVTTLRDVLANKQARGAFGQARMETIVQDGLPKGSFAFQYTLSTGKRPDCVVLMPDQPPLCIDAKFPLEAVTALREARTDEERKSASQRLRTDVMRHVDDIASKYLIPGETQDTALMFVPSESVYAEIHDGFDDVIQKAYRARVVLVSPSLLMLAIQVMQQILKDARMRDAADQIRTEVLSLSDDLARLRERVTKLQTHFGQVNDDVRQILISADKIERRAARIEELDFTAPEAAAPMASAEAHTSASSHEAPLAPDRADLFASRAFKIDEVTSA